MTLTRESFKKMEARTLLVYEWLMIVLFTGGMIFWGARMRKRAAGTLSETFLADRKVPGFIASISTVATNMNANDFIGMAGAIYGMGIVMLHQPLINALVLAFLGVFFMKKLRGRNAWSLGEWLRERYNTSVGNAYSIIWAFVWMLFNLGLYIYSGALVMHTLVGWNLYFGIVAMSAVAAIYTLLGGFRTVVATDVIQVALMFFPFIILAWLVWEHVGGPVRLLQSLPADKADLWHSPTAFGPLGLAIGGMVLISLSYWSSEAQVVQRPLAAKNPEDAAISYLGASFWYALLVPFVVFLPALAAIQLYPGLENNDFATPMLMRDFIPPGLYGVTIVGLLAGVFSSCDSQINAFCTVFTMDIYKRMIRPEASEEKAVRISKIAGVIFTLSAIGTAIIFTFAKDGMFLFAVGIVATIMPPFGAISIIGALWRRASPRAALVALIVGMTYASALFALDVAGALESWAKDTLYLRSGSTFLLTAFVLTAVSSFENYSDQLSFDGTLTRAARGFSKTNVLSVLLVSIVALMYFIISLLR